MVALHGAWYQEELFEFLGVLDVWRARLAARDLLVPCQHALRTRVRPMLVGGPHGEAYELDWSTGRWVALPPLGSAGLVEQQRALHGANVGGASDDEIKAAMAEAAEVLDGIRVRAPLVRVEEAAEARQGPGFDG